MTKDDSFGLENAIALPICACTLIVSVGPYVSDHYIYITFFISFLIIIFVKKKSDIRREAAQKNESIIRWDCARNTSIIRNRTIGIPGRSQKDLEKFQTGRNELYGES